MTQTLSDHDSTLIGECLRAVAVGPFLQDANAPDPWWEFATVMGLTHAEFSAIADQWPIVDIEDPTVRVAISNAINNLIGYPHGCERQWSHFISA